MIEIFLVQFLMAALGAASTAIADWLYHGGRIRQRSHSFWVSASIAAICMPLLVWTCCVFLGSGLSAQLVTGVLATAMFLWVYRNLQKLPTLENSTTHLPQRPSNDAVPPASQING